MQPPLEQLPDVLELKCLNTNCPEHGKVVRVHTGEFPRYNGLIALPRLRCSCLREPMILTPGLSF